MTRIATKGRRPAGAAATATIVIDVVAAITVTNGGVRYTSAPTVAITGGGGGGATAVATVDVSAGRDAEVAAILNDWNNTTPIPFDMTDTAHVSSITVTNGGAGYTSAPTVDLAGGGGTGAAGTAIVLGGAVVDVVLTACGTGYTGPPNVSLTGGGGTGAAATATITQNLTQAWFDANRGDAAAGYSLRTINAGNRILHSPQIGGNGEFLFSGSGPTLNLYAAFIGPNVWTSGQVQQDLIASGNHERLHAVQMREEKTNVPSGNIHRLLDEDYGGSQAPELIAFQEAEAHLTELEDEDVGWFHAISTSKGDLERFHTHLGRCVQTFYPRIPPGATQTAAKSFLQELYYRIPEDFENMRRAGYDYHVRPPR